MRGLRLRRHAQRQGQSIPKELGTRVNQNAPKPANPKVQSVQFFPNPKLKKKPDA